ncbi:D-2-hydroxyacid dehydrogenase [Alkalibacter saccharofermentans]|uniref:Glycerate dehydrogenase n=1 Tax=Alkalibacter saccharofermentans DSM 14828 TaxID=1120975 RepID=A0A1M4SB76_9FIRM|nr:D-2-hydroxyacid dehydrogenase [Alkalibacter saccharofermentans]SHE29449.1 glycerate dehydrogenase [Alkalibacter saccharofermentans DSM 14828]
MKIVVLDGYTLNPGDLSWNDFLKLGELIVYDRTSRDEISNHIGDAEIVLTNKTSIDKDLFKNNKNIKYVGVLATGYNVVDIAAAKDAGAVVSNIPDYGTHAVAQFTFALLLELCHRVQLHSDAVKSGQWSSSTDFCFFNNPLTELSGKTMGIVGFGRIGRQTARIAKALGMKIAVHSRSMPQTNEFDELEWCGDIHQLARESDVISLHCPLTEETRGIIDEPVLDIMKETSFLINTARGPLVDEKALYQALKDKKIAGAGLDVLSKEPPREDSPLFSLDNVLITPHIAWAAKESRERLMKIAYENLKSFLEGKPVNLV